MGSTWTLTLWRRSSFFIRLPFAINCHKAWPPLSPEWNTPQSRYIERLSLWNNQFVSRRENRAFFVSELMTKITKIEWRHLLSTTIHLMCEVSASDSHKECLLCCTSRQWEQHRFSLFTTALPAPGAESQVTVTQEPKQSLTTIPASITPAAAKQYASYIELRVYRRHNSGMEGVTRRWRQFLRLGAARLKYSSRKLGGNFLPRKVLYWHTADIDDRLLDEYSVDWPQLTIFVYCRFKK